MIGARALTPLKCRGARYACFRVVIANDKVEFKDAGFSAVVSECPPDMERLVMVAGMLVNARLGLRSMPQHCLILFSVGIGKVAVPLLLALVGSGFLEVSAGAFDDRTAQPPRSSGSPDSRGSGVPLASIDSKPLGQRQLGPRASDMLGTSPSTPSSTGVNPAPLVDPPAAVSATPLKRYRVRDEYGRLVAARWYGEDDGKTALLLPDGQLGITRGLVPTDDPFTPLDSDELRKLLQHGPYSEFQVLTSAHYLIFYKSTLTFAEDSTRLLETLYRGLLDVFKRHDIPVHEAEFPLVAVIFATEEEFRSHKEVDSEVQAYYEIFTNRIFFYQRSERDQREPRLAALRKPQTVAHEGAHQILANLGVQPRLSAWPLWLVEGLAEYCATPASGKRKRAIWDGLGMVNPLHMVTIRELDQPGLDQPAGGPKPEAARGATDKMVSRTESLLLKDRLTPTDYAEAWALTHYLAQKRRPEFVNFLREMTQIPPLQPRSAEQNLAVFTRNFAGSLPKFDKRVDDHLVKLSAQKNYDPLPYYAVIFEQAIAVDRVRRAAYISQSPQMIRQWVDQMTLPNGVEPSWQFLEYPTRATAYNFASRWMRGE